MLLSPPRQRDNLQKIPGKCPVLFRISAVCPHIILLNLPPPFSSSVTHPVLLHQEHSPVDLPHSYRHVQAHSSASSLTSLPLSSLPSSSSLSLTPDALSSELSPEAMLAEIAQLSRQNDLIKAQLSQTKGFGSVFGGLPNDSNGQRRLSSSSTGRVTPQNVGEIRASTTSTVTNSTGRTSQHVQAAEREQATNKVR